MYGSKLGDINSPRYEKFIERFSAKPGEELTSYNGVDITPCWESLKIHVRRANYQALIWKKADQATPSIPGPDGHSWTIASKVSLKPAGWMAISCLRNSQTSLPALWVHFLSMKKRLLSITKILVILFLKMTFDKLVQKGNLTLQGVFRALNMKPEAKWGTSLPSYA